MVNSLVGLLKHILVRNTHTTPAAGSLFILLSRCVLYKALPGSGSSSSEWSIAHM
jgi:hypothetical protein